ncbi:MAG: deoxyribodipyrimidine photo-lyase [Saprospiraceae bacterium]|jgi:deoxyribodipyrimidine photo-lyase
MKRQRVIVWFRQDLRLHDNEALTDAIKSGEEVYPVYVFDERVFKGETKFGFAKTEKHRAKFIIESVLDLRASLRKLGSNLIIRTGKPEEEIFELARQIKSSWVFCNRERTKEEVDVQDSLEQHLWSIGQEIVYSRGKMLYYTQDLPFPVTHCPDAFSTFRKEVERIVPIREPLPSPREHFNPRTTAVDSGEMPTLSDFDMEDFEIDTKAGFHFKGGEKEGLKRLKYYLWETDLAQEYFDSRNGMIGADYSTKFSAWLSQGCLSSKMVYYELKRYESERGENKSTFGIFFELLWRDFFRLMGKKHGNNIFLKGGTRQESVFDLKNDIHLLNLWIEGRTGVPLIDANMRELAATGFMSNRGRQNVASFLIKDLKINWQMGAEYFESLLIDYDPCSNWGNWNYIAGVGSDPRENRYFNILTQARKFDPNGDYVRHWLPELSEIPNEKIHQPDLLSEKEQLECHIKIGADYPKAMISTLKWN